MEEDAPNLIVVLVINIIIFIVIPLVMAYRRGYLFNISEHFNWIKGLFAQKNQCLPKSKVFLLHTGRSDLKDPCTGT